MKIAFIGQKGIPAIFGGVESHVETLATLLAKRGHTVAVYVRDWYTARETQQYNLVRLVHTPTLHTKHLDAFLHSLTSSLHSIFQNYDIVHYHAMGSTFFSFMPLLLRKRVVATIHRLDWEAGKWGNAAKAFLKLTERMALYIPHKTIVVSKSIKEYIEAKYRRKVFYIPNGVTLPEFKVPGIITEKYGLKGNDYILFMGRFVPEKRVDWLIEGFKAIERNGKERSLKLVLAGGSSATEEYVRRLENQANGEPDIIFTGYVTGKEKAELLSNALLFVLPSYLEGNPIALLEAMSYGQPCLVSDIPPHKEIVTDEANGFLFRSNEFNEFLYKLRISLKRRPGDLKKVAEDGKKFVKEQHDWETIVTRVEEIYNSVM